MESVVKVEPPAKDMKKDVMSNQASLHLDESEVVMLPDDINVDPNQPDAEVELFSTNDANNEISWSHQEAMAKFHAGLSDCLQNDPYLNDLPESITLEEINLQISLEHGQAITVYVNREDGQSLPVVVDQKGTVLDLKKAIRRHMEIKLHRECGPSHISWRSVWKSYWLLFDNEKLTNDNETLKNYGIGNMSEVKFIKRLSLRK